MKKFRFLMPIGFLAIAAGFSAIVMLLWNWLMPVIFGLITINFWQALGLLVLARILFGNFGFGKRRMMHHDAMHKKWLKMTPEQREEFINSRHRSSFGGHFNRDRFNREESEQ